MHASVKDESKRWKKIQNWILQNYWIGKWWIIENLKKKK